nr:cytochrome bd-I oxidase subunit CydX [Acinetobacter baumannii]
MLGILMECFASVLRAIYIEHYQNLDEE